MSVTGCLYLCWLPGERVLFWYIFANTCAARYLCSRRQVKVKVHLALPAMAVRLWRSLLSQGVCCGQGWLKPSWQCTSVLSQGGGIGAGMLQLQEGKTRRTKLGSRAKGGYRGLACLLLPLPGRQGATAAGFDLGLWQELRLPAGLAQAEQAAWPRSLCCQ